MVMPERKHSSVVVGMLYVCMYIYVSMYMYVCMYLHVCANMARLLAMQKESISEQGD